jgi:hypothetical protein
MKISNTWKHVLVSLAVLAVVWLVDTIIHAIDPKALFEVFWFAFIVLCIYAVRLEYLQWKWSHCTLIDYLKRRWIDTLLDLAAGIMPFLIGGWLLGLT